MDSSSQFAKVVSLSPTATFCVIVVLFVIVIWMSLRGGIGGFMRSNKMDNSKPLSKSKENELDQLIDEIHRAQGN
jgi:hypothetical protein